MALFRRATTPSVITAAASRIIDPTDPRARSKSPDAESLYTLYTELGPIHAALQSKFLAASKITYYPAVKDNPDEDPEPLDDGPVREAYDRLQGPQGEFADFVAEMAMHWEIAGEGYLVGKSLESDEEWDVWSPVEYDQNRSGLKIPEPDAVESLTDGDFVMRSWRAHPMLREKPDSPLRSVVRQCEQLIAFQDMLTALGRSRLLGPLTIWPNEMVLPDADENGTKQTIFDILYNAMNEAVIDNRSSSRLVGPALSIPAAYAEAVRTVSLTQDIPEWVPKMIEDITRQIAIGLDLPADILTGIADVNHWSAWLIDDSLRLNYVDPLVLAVLDSFTRGYLWPSLREAGVPDPEQFLFWRDYSDLTSRTVTPADAMAALEANLISPEAARRSIGFTEADAPEDDTPNQAPPEVLVEERDIPTTLPAVLAASAAQPSLAQIDHRVYTQISEAAQAALDRALEKAGAKIRAQALGATRGHENRAKETFAQVIDGVDNMLVAQTLGREAVATLQLSDDQLIPEEGFSRLGQRVEKILRQGQDDTYTAVSQITGQAPPRKETEERGWITLAVSGLLSAISSYAMSRLYTPAVSPDPGQTGEIPSTEIPPAQVFDAMTTASGSTPGKGPDALRGLANGQMTVDWAVSAGFEARERLWSVGAPTQPFEPHRALSGVVFEQWTAERLKTPLTASWIGYDFMFPGDHRGCQCVAELVLEKVEAPKAHTAIDPPPDYVNLRPSTETLSVKALGSSMSASQTSAVQEAFRSLNQRWPGAVAELQEMTVSSDITAFATKSKWSIVFNKSLVGDVSEVRKNWLSFANNAIPGQIATKAGGALNDVAYLRNVALHEMSHVAEGRFRAVASVTQRERLAGLWEEILDAQRTGQFEKLPSLYATENSGEFFAEALSDALIGDSPNPMSIRVADLFDEVFG